MSVYNKVFGIGLSRTGTTSLNSALNMLDLKSIHFPTDDTTYSELIFGKYNLSILQQYDALTDITASPFYAELDKAFPNSLFILTIRNKKDWLKSMKTHIEKNLLNGLWITYLKSTPSNFSEESYKYIRICYFLHSVCYGCLAYCEEKLERAFDLHIENVQNYFRGTNKLLTLNICEKEGWEKLCPFLHKLEPNIDFPKENKTIKKFVLH